MPTITAISAQVKNKDRVNVHLDGRYGFSLAVAAAHGLSVGDSLSDEQIAARQAQDSLEKAKQQLYRLLTSRPRTVQEIRRYLQGKGYDEAQIELLVTFLQEKQLLDDAAFTEYWVEQRLTFKPRSQMALRYELQQKGVSHEVMAPLLAEVDEAAAATDAAHRQLNRLRHLPWEQFQAKLGGYLQRRGFQYETIRQVVNDLWRELQNE